MDGVYEMKKILITGADGFIGSHLVEFFVKKGYEVKALCLYNSIGSWGWLDSIDEKTFDIKNKRTSSSCLVSLRFVSWVFCCILFLSCL